MKKYLLILFCILFANISNASVAPVFPENACIEYNQETGKIVMKGILWCNNPMHGNQTAPYLGIRCYDALSLPVYPKTYLFIQNPLTLAWILCNTTPVFTPSYYTIPGSPTYISHYEVEYEIDIPGFDPSLCYKMAILTDAYLDCAHPDFVPWSGIDPTVDNDWDGINLVIQSTYVAIVCPCDPENPPAPCSSNFTFKLESNTSDPWGGYRSYGDIILDAVNPWSSYDFDYGNAPLIPTIPPIVSKLYTPGTYTVCVTETQLNGTICKTCIDVCVSDPRPTVSGFPSSIGCESSNFTFATMYSKDIYGSAHVIGQILPNMYNPTSTYTYDYGGGVVTSLPFSKIYSPGTYTVCLTEHKADGSFCTTCMEICIAENQDPGFQKTTESLITKDSESINQLSIYPNPATLSAELKIGMVKQENVSVQVIDMTGKKVADVYNGALEEGTRTLTINTENLASGLYQVKIMIGNKVTTQKLSVVK